MFTIKTDLFFGSEVVVVVVVAAVVVVVVTVVVVVVVDAVVVVVLAVVVVVRQVGQRGQSGHVILGQVTLGKAVVVLTVCVTSLAGRYCVIVVSLVEH